MPDRVIPDAVLLAAKRLCCVNGCCQPHACGAQHLTRDVQDTIAIYLRERAKAAARVGSRNLAQWLRDEAREVKNT